MSKFIFRTSIATTLLGLVSLDCTFAAPAKLPVGTSAAAQATVAQAAASGPGWTAVEQLIQTFDGANTSNTVAPLAASKSDGQSNSAKSTSLSRATSSSKITSKTAKATSKSAAKASVEPSNLIDYQEMSLRCLGKKDWDGLTVSQRSQFVASLKGLVEQRYYPRWHKIFGKGKVTFQEEVSQGGDIIVRTKLLLGKKEELLSWRVAGPSGSQKIVSLSVSNSDLLERLKSRIKARQKKVGFDALLAWMKGHSNEELTISSGSTATSATSATVLPIAAVRSHSLTAAAANAISD